MFLQWLDCVWQLLIQKPHEFQFNELFLIETAAHLHSGRFGTFMGDTIEERTDKVSLCWGEGMHD